MDIWIPVQCYLSSSFPLPTGMTESVPSQPRLLLFPGPSLPDPIGMHSARWAVGNNLFGSWGSDSSLIRAGPLPE